MLFVSFISIQPCSAFVTQTVESIFYMWRLTGDVKWRQRGYEYISSYREAHSDNVRFTQVSMVSTLSVPIKWMICRGESS